MAGPQVVSFAQAAGAPAAANDPPDVAKARRRSGKIWNDNEQHRTLLDQIHEYIQPMRRHASKSGGVPNMDKIFDGTGPKANFRFAGRVQADLTPPDEQFFALEAGPVVQNDDDRKALNQQLDPVSKIVDATFSTGEFQTASHEMYADLFAGQGALLTNPGDTAEEIVRDVAVPTAEIALKNDAYGRVGQIVWRREHSAEEIAELFDKKADQFSEALQSAIRQEQDKPFEVTRYTYKDRANGRWQHCALVRGEPMFMEESQSRTCPWLTPRFFVLPGMANGFGVAHLALPSIKTANKGRELALKAAAFALLGLWAQRDDGVFDPDTARFAPGTFWKVGSTGGPLGPSVTRMDIPNDFDISSVVIQDEREQIKQATFDDTLPPIAGAVRSPTEIVERMRRLDMDWAGVDGRLAMEIVRPAVARRLEILEARRILPTRLTIDQLLVRVSITSPIARARRTRRAQTIVEGLTLVQSLGGQELTMLVAEIEEAMIEIMREIGVPERLIRSKADRTKLQQMIAQIVANQQMAAAGAQGAAA